MVGSHKKSVSNLENSVNGSFLPFTGAAAARSNYQGFSVSVANGRREPLFSADKSGSIGFITCRQSLTSVEAQAVDRWERETLRTKKARLNRLFDESGSYVFGSSETGFRIKVYPSGEITGGSYCRNPKAVPPGGSGGAAVSESLTDESKRKIRRALENSPYRMRVFCTLTFDPSKSVLDENGQVCQTYAKKELKRFLNTCAVRQSRVAKRADSLGVQGETLQYVWVAERQQNGNIHFHIVWNVRFPIQWLTDIWKQASNSVDVKRLSSVNHASSYIRKYITKTDYVSITGRRYNITQGLHEAMRPEIKTYEGIMMRKEIKEIVDAMKEEIEQNGGHVIDFGFSIPHPRDSVEYEDKKGNRRKTRGVSARPGQTILHEAEKIQAATAAPF